MKYYDCNAGCSLRNNLVAKKNNPNNKFYNYETSQLSLVHEDFHMEIYLFTKNIMLISDLGLCRPANRPNIEDEI